MIGIQLHLLCLIFVKGIVFCTCKICLNWSINNNQLRLNCKVDRMYFDISFFDPFHHEQAVCLVSYPEPICHCHHNNCNIERTMNQRETITVLTIIGNTDRRINGMWTCRHGKNYEVSTVEIATNQLAGLASPDITANQSLPFISGTIVELVCRLEVVGNAINLQWDCLNVSAYDEHIMNCTTHVSKLMLMVSTFLDGKTCKCIARNTDFGATAQIKLDVVGKTILEMPEEFICKNSFNVSLSCVVHVYGTSTTTTFAPWIHTYNGTFIRYISGIENGNVSTILIQSCSFEDAGQYTCRVWKNILYPMLTENKTSTLLVSGAPIIFETSMEIGERLTFAAEFLSFPPSNKLEWFLNSVSISNSTIFMQTTSESIILLKMYRTIVQMKGFVTKMSTEHFHRNGFRENLLVFIQNDSGNVTHMFPKEKDRRFHTFDIRTIVWITVSTSIFVIAIVGTCFLVSRMHSINNFSIQRQIYYAAPQDANLNSLPVYSITESHYDEIQHHYLEVVGNNSETDKDSIDNSVSEHYIEID